MTMALTGRTLVSISEAINLTEKKMWAYGSSGALFELKQMSPTDFLKSLSAKPPKGTYYVAEGKTKELLLKDPFYKERILEERRLGGGRNGENIFSFTTQAGLPAICITDRVSVSAQNIVGYKKSLVV